MEEKCQDETASLEGQAGDVVFEGCSMEITFDGEDEKCQDKNDVESE